MDCLFCKIIANQIPSTKVYEDSKIIAIRDINPQAPIHYLFIPRQHIESLNSLDQSTLIMSELFSAIRETAKKEGFAEKGFRTSINTNKEGCQSVLHLHVHCLAGTQLGGNMVGI